MPFIKSSAFKYYTYAVTVIFLFSEIMPPCSYYKEKKLVYIIIMALSSHQPSFYIKYIKLNMRSSCNIRLVSNTEYLWFTYFIIF